MAQVKKNNQQGCKHVKINRARNAKNISVLQTCFMVNNESQCSWKWKLASIDGN
jgi:hypothetical protein